MFGLGRRRHEEIRRLQSREDELSQQLEQAQAALLEATGRAEKAEAQTTFLSSQNRALAAKVHRLALQRVELQNDNDQVLRENKELQITNLQLEGEARAAKASKADAWMVPNLQAALRQQAAQHEKKLESLKRRTKALFTAMLPGGQGQADVELLSPGDKSAPGSPGSDSSTADLWDAPLTPPPQVEYNRPDVNVRVRQIIEYLYDETLSEDQALEQMTAITREILPQLPQQEKLLSRGCSPFPVPKLTAPGAQGPAEKVDAATGMLTSRGYFVSDVATETPAEMSYIGTPRDVSAAPSLAPNSPSRLGAGGGSNGVPALDLAALVAQAMEDAPLSARSTASTSAGGSGTSFNAFSQFVLAQPEKLQRLIMRHAAATGSRSGAALPPQSPYSGGAMPSVTAPALEPFRPNLGPNSLDPPSLPSARPSFTSRLLGLGGGINSSSSATASRANATENVAPAGPPLSSINSTPPGVLTPSSAGNTMAPAKQSKRPGLSGVPKIVAPDGSASMSSGNRGTDGPVVTLLPGAKLLSGLENSGGVARGMDAGKAIKVDQLEKDFQDMSFGGSSALIAFRPSGSGH